MAQQPTSRTHIVSLKTNLPIFGALLVLLVLTIVAARFNLGVFNMAIALTIASAKALLIILYFMHVRYSSKLAWLFAGAGFFWLGIMVVLMFADYASRGWVPGTGR